MGRLLVLLAILAATCAWAGAVAPSCTGITQMLTPCMTYLSDRAWVPYGSCCNGIVALNQTAPTREDRVAVCNCLKSIATRFPRVDLARAVALPSTCGVNLTVSVSPYIDCNSLPPP